MNVSGTPHAWSDLPGSIDTPTCHKSADLDENIRLDGSVSNQLALSPTENATMNNFVVFESTWWPVTFDFGQAQHQAPPFSGGFPVLAPGCHSPNHHQQCTVTADQVRVLPAPGKDESHHERRREQNRQAQRAYRARQHSRLEQSDARLAQVKSELEAYKALSRNLEAQLLTVCNVCAHRAGLSSHGSDTRSDASSATSRSSTSEVLPTM